MLVVADSFQDNLFFTPSSLFLGIEEQTMIPTIKTYFERQAFGVCAWWGEKLNIKTEQVRLSFIYLGCITAGLPLVGYLIMAFVLKHKVHIKRPFAKRSTVWEL